MSDQNDPTRDWKPGWYDDGSGTSRYWDGHGWTQNTTPGAGGSQPKKKGMRFLNDRKRPTGLGWASIGGGAVVALIIIGAASGGSSNSEAASAPSSRSAAPTPTATAAAASVTVPDLVGEDGATARDALEALGLEHTYDAGDDVVVLASHWKVTGQSVKAGSKVAPGSTVTLTVVKPTQTPAPQAPKAPAAPQKPAGPTLTASQEQAVIAAQGYLDGGMGFSYQGLIDQLSSSYGNGFSVADATAAVNSLHVDYNAQALLAAKGYLSDGQGFSHASLVAQLDSAYGNKFTVAQAEAAVTAAGL